MLTFFVLFVLSALVLYLFHTWCRMISSLNMVIEMSRFDGEPIKMVRVCKNHWIGKIDNEGDDILLKLADDYCSHECKIKHMEKLCGSPWEEDWVVWRVQQRLQGQNFIDASSWQLESIDFVPMRHNGFQRLLEQRRGQS